MRLSKEDIREILTKHSEGVAISKIAREHSVDSSTVRYHVERFEDVYGSTAHVYAVIRPVQNVCHHPSMKCLICGVAQDSIRRRELDEIERLTIDLNKANLMLEQRGLRVD